METMTSMNASAEMMRSRIVDRGKQQQQQQRQRHHHPDNTVSSFSSALSFGHRMVREASENREASYLDTWGGSSAGGARVAGKFAVDDSVLADLVDLDDPLGEKLETWMATSSQMSEFALSCSYSPLPPANPSHSSMMYANAGLQSLGSEYLQELSTCPEMSLSSQMLRTEGVSLQQSSGEGEVERGKSSLLLEEEKVGSDKSRSRSRATATMDRLISASLPPLAPLSDRLMQAVRCIGRLRVDMLVQTWVPVSINGGSKRVLSTRDQPYALELKNNQLWFFRTVSESFEFPTVENDGTSVAGLPGRVFARQEAEWSPNVQLFTSLEYPRWKEAQRCDIRASLAVPVLDPISNECVAVIELVGRTEKVQFGPDVDVVNRALQVTYPLLPPWL